MFYIFHGSNEFSAKETLARLKTRLGDAAMVDLNTTELEGATLTLKELIHHANAIPFLSPKRVVIVYGYLSKLSGSGRGKGDTETLKKLAAALQDLPPTTNLVFMEAVTLKASHPILKLAQETPKSVHLFDLPKAGQLPQWIVNRTAQKGGQIDYPAASALANVMGDDLRALDNEIEKLTLYVNNQRPIRLSDVELLCPYTADSETFAMTKAIGRRDARAALDQLHKRLQEGQNALAILGGIAAQFRGLLEVKSMAAAGLSPAEIARKKGWRSDYAAKMRLQEARRFSLEQLTQIFSTLLETDKAIKTGQIEAALALDLLVSRLCG